jgi:hypothetical protein
MSSRHKINSILNIIQYHDLDHDDTWNLIEQLNDIYRIKTNNIIQKIPRETWEYIIDLADRKKEMQTCICFRIVCKMWNNIIQNFTKITMLKHILPKNHNELFPKLKTLITCSRYDCEASSFTNLTKLKLIGSQNYDGWNLATLTNITTLSIVNSSSIFDHDLEDLTHLTKLKLYSITYLTGRFFQFLTNLKHLKLSNNTINTQYISYLTNLQYLKISVTHRIKNEHISHLTNLTIIRI